MARLAGVSGGGTGIGRATAGMLAGEGYDVIIAGRRPDVLADAVKWIGPQATAVTVDVDDSTLDGLAAHWRANFESNVITAVLLTAGLRPLLRRPGGRIILTSSIAAQRGGGGP